MNANFLLKLQDLILKHPEWEEFRLDLHLLFYENHPDLSDEQREHIVEIIMITMNATETLVRGTAY